MEWGRSNLTSHLGHLLYRGCLDEGIKIDIMRKDAIEKHVSPSTVELFIKT